MWWDGEIPKAIEKPSDWLETAFNSIGNYYIKHQEMIFEAEEVIGLTDIENSFEFDDKEFVLTQWCNSYCKPD